MKKILALLVFALTLLVPSAVAQTYEPVVYPAQQDAVGTANLDVEDGTYTFSNSLFTAQFVTTDGHLMFGGCDEMNLKAGTELFVITFGDGTVVNASQMTLGEVTTGNLAVNSSAAKGAEHFPGKYLQAVHTYTKGSAHVTFTWRAELRDGSHYLRTDLTMTSDQDVQMSSIVPMQYAVDALAAGSTPAVVGNTRGAVLMSNKIFAGLETPTAYNSVVSETTVPEKWSNYGAWTADYFSWTPAELPTGITNLSSKYNTSNVVGARGYLKFETAGSQTITFTYSKGSHKLNIVGVDVLDTNGNVVAHDYHQGYTGGNQKDKVYTLDIPSAGYYQVRYFVTTLNWSEGYGDESITSEGNIAYSGTVSIPTVVFDLDPVAPASTRRKVLSADHIGNNENITDTWDTSTNQFQDMNDADVPARIVELGHTANNIYYREQDFNISVAGGTLTTTFTYKGGNNRLQIVGVDLVDGQGNIAVNDYHFGFTGNEAEDNTYKFIVPAAGQYKLRYLVSKQGEDLTSNGDIAINYEVIDYLHLPAPAEVTIQGLWSRQTTLKASTGSNLTDKDVVWNVSSVVGIVNPDHKRRSFLAYSERERAVAWRPFPHYNSWFELNINRNNAAPGSEATNSWVAECTPVVEAWKTNLYDKYGVGVKSFVWDDGWDQYGEWQHHSGYPNGFKEPGEVANSMNAGIGAWLGPVGGYGTSGGYRRDYWNKEGRGGMSLSNKAYYDVFKAACERLVKTDAENYGHEFNFFKFDGISSQFSAVGPDAGATGNESAEGIIGCERYVRENLKEDIFFNTSVGTWASPFWFHFTDAVWRQENDYGTAGNGANDREKWITYRDRLVYQNFVQRSPICPINTIMTHGFILHQRPDGNYDGVSHDQSYKSALNELRCAFASGDAMVELYADHRLLTSINDGALWKDIADCIKWQEANKDVLPDIHWVGGNPWTGSKSEIYGWASWNGTKATLTLRNGAPTQQTFTTKLRDALDVPASCTSSVYLVGSFDDLKGTLKQIADIDDNTPISLDTEITFTLPASSVYVFDGSINKFTDASFDLPETEPVTAGDLSALTITFTGEAAANVKLSTDKHTAYLTKKAASAQVKAQNGKFNAPRLKAAEAPAGAIEGNITAVAGETGKFSIAFPEESIEAGDYEVSIPAGTFYVGTEGNPVAELKANYTVEEAAIPTDNISDVINYGHLLGANPVDEQWIAVGNIPAGITNNSDIAENYKASGKVYEISKVYEFETNCLLKATFQHANGNSHKTNILGVEVVNMTTGEVVASDYHYGSTGGSNSNNVYTTTEIPAGTYKVNYIVSSVENQIGGTITNALLTKTFSPEKIYTIYEPDDSRGYMAYNPANDTYVGLADVTLNGHQNKHAKTATSGEEITHWNIIEEPAGTVKLYNIQHEKYLGLNGSNQAIWVEETNAATFTYTTENDGETYIFQSTKTANNNYLNPCCGYEANNGPVRLGSKEPTSDWTIAEVVVPVEPLTTTLSPEAETTVKSSDLATITVTFTGDGAEKVCFDEEWPAVLADEEMVSYVAGITTKVSDGVFEIAFDTAEITEGQWTLNVSDGFFYIPGEPNTELPGFLAPYTVEASEVILQDRHLYTIKGAFSDDTYAPFVYANNTITAGAVGATPETFVFLETTHTNNAGLSPVFKLGTVEGNGYFVYGGTGITTTKSNAADVSFPTSTTTLQGGVAWDGSAFKEGYFGMVGLSGTNTYRTYVVKPNTVNYNTRDENNKVWGSNTLNNTENWCSNYVIEEVKGYTVYDIVNDGSATVNYNGEAGNCLTTVAQGNGGYIVLKDGVTPSESNLNITGIPAGYTAAVSVSDHTITITATADSPEAVIQAPIDYNPLNGSGSVWSTLEASKLPDGIKALDPTNFTAANLRVIEKQYTFTRELSNLQSTFQYTTGSHRTDIVGVDIVNGDGNVVYSDYHFGWTGSNGSKLDNVYTIENILPGQYTVRYFSTAKSAGQSNTATNGTITNTLPPSAIYTVHLSETTKVTSGTPQVYRKGQVYGEGDSFTAISGSVTPDQISSAHDYLGVDVVIAADGENFNVNATYTTLYHPTWRTDGFEGKEGTTHALKTDGTTKYMIFDTATQGTEDWAGFMYPNGNKVGKTNPCTPLEFKGPEMYLWTVEDANVETGDGFYLKNVATGKYYDGYGNPHADKETAAIIYIQNFPEATMAKADSTAHSVNRYEEPIVDINDDKGCWVIGASREAMTEVGNGPCWNGGKAAFNAWWCSSPFAFYEVVTLEKDLQNTEDIKDVLIDYCQYFEGMNDNSHDYRTYQEKVADAESLNLNGSFTEYVNILREEKDMKVSYPQPVEIEGKKYGRFITVRNAVNLDYLKGSAVSMDRAVMWLNADNELVSFDTGLGYSGTTAATPVADAKAFDVLTLSEVSPKRGTLVVKTSDNKYLASSGDREHGTSFTSQTEATTTNATTWYVDNADYVIVNIPASGYTTFYAPVPMAVSYTDGTADADIYCVKANEGSDETGLHVCTLELSKMVNFIPAGQAVILKGNPGTVRINVLYDGYTLGEEGSCGTNEETYFYDEMTQDVVDTYNAINVLKAYDYTYVNRQTSASGGVDGKYIYTLSNGKFQYYTGSTIKAFKCFLELTQDYRAGYNRDAAANPFRIIFNDDATGISGTHNGKTDGNAFDLSGRRINVQSQRGLYIQNGKKVVR